MCTASTLGSVSNSDIVPDAHKNGAINVGFFASGEVILFLVQNVSYVENICKCKSSIESLLTLSYGARQCPKIHIV